MKLCIYIFILLLSVQAVTARQNDDLRKANYLYAHLAYHEAIAYYNKAAASINDPATLGKVGDCYRLTKNVQQANIWYAKAAAMPACPAVTKLHYAQTLLTTGDHALALTMVNQYLATNPNDRRAQNIAKSCEYADTLTGRAPAGYVRLLAFNSNGSEFGPALRKNELYFTSDTMTAGSAKTDKWTGAPFYNIYSTNNSMTSAFDHPQELPGKPNDRYHDGPCSFNNDGSTMYFTRTNFTKQFLTRSPVTGNDDIVRLEIMIATDYDEATKKYRKLIPFKYNNKDYSCAHPSISQDERKLFFIADMKGGTGGTDIYICERTGDGNWGEPKNAGMNINTEGNELFPYIDIDNTLYFASDGHVGYGGLDLYMAKWNDTTRMYNAPVNMGMPVNSPYDDISMTFNRDKSVGYFASDRPAEKKGDNIYSYSTRPLYLSVTGIDSVTKVAVSNYKMSLLNAEDTGRIVPGRNGQVVAKLYPHVAYTWLVTAPHYQPQHILISNRDTAIAGDTVFTTLKFDPHVHISLNLTVVDEDGATGLEESKIVYYRTGQTTRDTVDANKWGQYRAQLDADNTYHFLAIKNNYTGNEQTISTKGITPESGRVTLSEQLNMKKMR